MKYDLYISHSSKDKEFVRKLANDLIKNGLTIWLDEWNMIPGESFADSMNQAMRDSKYILIIMSPAYFSSEWTKQEYNFGMYEELNSNKVKIIPVLYKQCDIPIPLKSKLYIDFSSSEKYKPSLEKLIKDLYLIEKEKLLLKEDYDKDEQIVGLTIEKLDNNQIAEISSMLKKAVDAFKSQPQDNQTKILIDKKLCFIVMPFGKDDLNIVYEDFVKPSIDNECKLICERGDDVFGSNIIMEDIGRSIERARIIVADLTGRNPNVFYEVGIAHTLNKPVLLLAQDIEDVPFDLRHRRALLYEYSPRGCKKLEKDIVKNVYALLNENK
ncbi:MAG: toll/interleukin-1 receptor domain-containing protein [Bacteroidales bacterium]|nr:toll/interleukin-1 receptor domain-containing protein [Bacteroidales bacterium]